jgi:hypothetical protein
VGENETDEIQALVPLYKSVLCAFARRGTPFKKLKDLRDREVRAYLGQRGSGSRYLVDKILLDLGIRCIDVHSDWTPRRVAETMSRSSEEQDFDVAFVLDKLDSGVVRTIVDGGKHDLMTLDTIEDLFHPGAPLAGRRSVRKVSLQPSSLSEVHSVPNCEVATIESQTILACTATLADWHAYQSDRIAEP